MNFHLLKRKVSQAIIITVIILPLTVVGQNKEQTLTSATLEEVVAYAITHQPDVKQAEIDEEITNKAIRGKLADWYPQVNFAFNYQRFIELQKTVFNGNVIPIGVNNTSSAQLTATQNVFNRDVLLASSTASEVREQAGLNTKSSKIDVVVGVTKAFYDVLATMQQIKVGEEAVTRLERSVQDAHNRYLSGVADKTDYKRATILLGNSKASLKSLGEALKYKTEFLKMVTGYPQESDISIQYDNQLMEDQIAIDTTLSLLYTNHISYQILESKKALQEANIRYSNWSFLPSLNLFGAYNLNYQNNNFGDLYNTKFPFSYVGATLSFPIAQGGKRVAKIQEQNLAGDRLDVSLTNLENVITTEYTRSISAYKSNLAQYEAQKENVDLAGEVYDIVQLQYQSGVRTYLDVIIAESDLRTTQINYFNTLYMVLASKMDVLRALGQINY